MAIGLSLAEQETVVLLARDGNTATIYTSDTRDRRRFNKMFGAMKTREYRNQAGVVVAEEFVVDRRLVTFRRKIPRGKTLTDEQKQELTSRLRLASAKTKKAAAAAEASGKAVV